MAIFWVFFFLSAGMYPCLKYFRALVRRLRADKPSTLPMALQRTFSWTQTPSAPLKLAMTWTASKKLPMVVAVVRSKVGYDGRLIAGRNVETRIVKRDAEGCGRMKWMSSEPFDRLCRVGWLNAERRSFRRPFAWGVQMRMWTSNVNVECKRQMQTSNANVECGCGCGKSKPLYSFAPTAVVNDNHSRPKGVTTKKARTKGVRSNEVPY